MEKYVPELCVQNPHVIEDDAKSEGKPCDTDEVKLVYRAPRLFRKSIIFKTMNLFGRNDGKEEKVDRPFKEK